MWLYISIMLSIVILGSFRVRIRGIHMARFRFAGMRERRLTEQNNRHPVFVLIFLLVFWCLAALKGSAIGSDTPNYIRVFLSAESWSNSSHSNFLAQLFTNNMRYESGYVLLNKLVALVFDDVQWLFILITTFCLYVFRKYIIRESQDVVLTVYLFISLRYLYFLMSGLRQAIAIYLCVIAYQFIKKRQLLPFVLLVLLASQFHITALVFLAAYPLSYLKFNWSAVLMTTVVGGTVFLLFDQVLSVVLRLLPSYYSHYTTTERFAENKLGNILMAAIQLIFLCVSFLSEYGKQEKTDKGIVLTREYDEASFMKFMILVSLLFSVISLRATTLDRLYYYYWIFALVYIPNVISRIRSSGNRLIIRSGTILFTFLYNVILLYFRPEWSNITPYVFFWQD